MEERYARVYLGCVIVLLVLNVYTGMATVGGPGPTQPSPALQTVQVTTGILVPVLTITGMVAADVREDYPDRYSRILLGILLLYLVLGGMLMSLGLFA